MPLVRTHPRKRDLVIPENQDIVMLAHERYSVKGIAKIMGLTYGQTYGVIHDKAKILMKKERDAETVISQRMARGQINTKSQLKRAVLARLFSKGLIKPKK